MKKDWGHLDKWRMQSGHVASRKGDHYGAFFIPFNNYILRVIATDGEADEDVRGSTEWEHVSICALEKVFNKELTPKWDMMCFVKDLFWGEDEVVIQFHPAKRDYVNWHEHVLHLWRYKKAEFAKPPTLCV